MARSMTKEEVQRYSFFGPHMDDALEAMMDYRTKIVNAIEQLEKCKAMGLLGCNHDLMHERAD